MNPQLISARAKGLSPYTPGEQPQNRKFIKLNTNENPYPPAPGVGEALATFPAEELRLYPDPASMELREKIARSFGYTREEVFVGNGSDEVLSFAFYGFFDPARGPVLFPEFTYSFYPVYCSYYGLEYRKIPLAPDFSVDLQPYLDEKDHAGIALPNPNAPTGSALPLRDIEAFLEKYPGDRIFILDEAYVDFGAESCSGLIRRFPNLLVVHTFSKSRSLAGLRVGYALGDPFLIRTLETIKDSFNSYPLDRLSQRLALRALEDRDYFEENRRKIIAVRNKTTRALEGMGWRVLPSRANFIFAELPGREGKEIYRILKDKGILVRHFMQEGIQNFLRISMGTNEEMEEFLEKIRDLGLTAESHTGGNTSTQTEEKND